MSDFKSDSQANPGAHLIQQWRDFAATVARADGRIGQRRCRAAAG